MNWYYGIAGQQHGPVTEAQLDQLLAEGKITAETPVWYDGLPDWQPYRQARGIAAPPPLAGDSPLRIAPDARPEAVCTECGRIYPADETIVYGQSRVCAACKPAFLQKLREGAAIQTGGLMIASSGVRVGAYLIDALILFAFNFVTGFIIGLSGGAGGSPIVAVVMFIVQITTAILYESIMVWKYGGTLGKLAVKIKVVTAEGQGLSFGRAVGRYFAKLLSGLICAIGFIIAFFDPEKRALHDRICNTRVVVK